MMMAVRPGGVVISAHRVHHNSRTLKHFTCAREAPQV
jgi:hypothetical protein